jgi:ribosomal protein S27AE
MVKEKAEKAIIEDFRSEKPRLFLVRLICKKCGPQEFRADNPPKIACPKCHEFNVKEVHVY